ncbi:MAG: lipid-A-disaccharide synthase N-terminal domain-containing protein [Planctomycetota bacterium]
MKAGPILAMIGLVLLGMWLVLQPTLTRGDFDYAVNVGAVELRIEHPGPDEYRFVEPERLAELGTVNAETYLGIVDQEQAAWEARPAFERNLLGFFNITSWGNFIWVAVGLGGQAAFFGRMMSQWVVSEKSRKSQVPELFWWLSLFGGLSLFTYFVWRTDVVGVLGQSTGVVIYARNLRLIMKQKRRERRAAEAGSDPGVANAATQ